MDGARTVRVQSQAAQDKIEDDKLFLQTLQSFILLLRWEIRSRTELETQNQVHFTQTDSH